ncbi:hypothetical protein SCHPADRAFT_74464 [Schizopora paradoxa]|uniref:Uncharacterized protein n=1 Tax=Schizopora paradoxa TaxID=27342 RepID=A0A0H2S556_9AGAM|nr:hypothetical protein SCHPADRAFT_74464 [Schizopora paradoxa]
MTRYESAWQNLLVKETELWKDTWGKEYSGKFEGRLYLHCNDPTAKLHFDMIDQDGRFSWDKILLRENDTKIDQGQPLANQPTLQEMIQVAQAHNSIVYTLKYGAYFPECHIWGGGVFQHTTKFYPFMRPFFHRVEKYMDNHLFSKMQELAVDKLKKSAVKVDNDNKGQSILNQGFAQMAYSDTDGILH